MDSRPAGTIETLWITAHRPPWFLLVLPKCRYPLEMEQDTAPEEAPGLEPGWGVRWVMSIVGGVIATVLAAFLLLPFGGSEEEKDSSLLTRDPETEVTPSAEPAPAGRELWTAAPVTLEAANSFSVALKSLVCGGEPEENGYWMDEVQGEVCIADLTFTNRGNTARTAPPIGHSLWVGENYFEPIGRRGDAFERAIFPDAMSDGRLYFDVPTGSAPTFLEVGFWHNDGGARFRLAE